MITVRDLIKGSLRLIGAIGTGETPTADEQAEALQVLNDMLESWSLDGFLVFKIDKETFSFISSQQAYTMGDGGDFDTVRPLEIVAAKVLSNGIETDIEVITAQQWADIQVKDSTSEYPQYLYIDGSSPLQTLNFWPTPSTANSVNLYSRKPLTAFASANDSLTLPPGYNRALKYNLAGELSIEYGKAINPALAAIAAESKAAVQRQNTEIVYLISDAYGLTGGRKFNILTGE